MNKKHIISLSGDLASGKGTVSNILTADLNYGIYRNGEYFRKLAKEMGMDVTSFNVYVKEHPEIDRQIENSAAEYAKQNDNFVIDARLGWYAVPESFKVYLKVDLDVSAQRAFYDEKRKSTEKFNTVEEQKQDIIRRYNYENERYWNLYQIRKNDMSNYDLVVDTTDKTPEEVAKIIEEEYSKWLEE
ncbi:cytidylate kinase [Clostridium sp. CAG:780]|jgi:cytidylate kinase|nr:cytidylate kinase [Clostridium sp. CAG:780]